ncbi:MAG TPA: T9SS type A sorting domain-containing protein [Candidatus Kapabacteria bacterium]|nr:T9SS type A sorting domain-containing protein [Candidatus Kapabacteria bacterium]
MSKSALYIVICIISYINLFSIDTVDVRPPLLSIYSDCGNCVVTASDNRNMTLNKDSVQIDVGIKDIPILLKSRSYNFDDIIINPIYTKDSIYKEMIFELKVKDKFDTAFAVFYIYDNSLSLNKNNVKYDSVKYYPQLMKFDKDDINYNQVYLDSILNNNIEFRNVSGFNFKIKDISLKYGKFFKILNNISKNYDFLSDEKLSLTIQYQPKFEINQYSKYDYDTLIIRNECLTYRIPLSGQGVLSKILVEDIDFGICEVGKTLVKDKNNFPETYDGMHISNIGSGILKINGYHFNPNETPFKLTNPIPSLNPSQIFPSSYLNVKPLSFEPTQAGEFFADLVISSNSQGPDSIASLRGIAYNKGPYMKVLNFGDQRVLSKTRKYISIKNSDSKPYSLYDLDLSDMGQGFNIAYEDMDPIPSKENPIVIYSESSQDNVLKEYIIPIDFIPNSEGVKEIKITPKFISNGNDLNLIVFNYIRGRGLLPVIELMGQTFLGRTLVNTLHPDTGYVTIYSRSKFANLFIKEINIIKQNDNSNDFIFTNGEFPKDTILKANSYYRFPVLFKPEESGERKIIIQVISDATKGMGERYDTVYAQIKGIAYNKTISVDQLTFTNVSHCDSTAGKLIVRNVSDTTTTEVYDIQFDKITINPFELDKSIFLSNPVILSPGDTFAFDIKFKPYLGHQNNYSVLTRVFSDDDTATTYIKGTSTKYNVLIYSDTISNGIPGMVTLNKEPSFIGQNYNINIKGDMLSKTVIDSIYLEIAYRKNDFRFMNYIENGNAIKDWNINYQEFELSKDSNIIKILCYGLKPINESGILITPAFMIMLGDTNGVAYNIRNISFFSKGECSASNLINGLINLSYCGEELRKILISQHLFKFEIVNTNLISTESLKVAYNVAFSTTTELSIYNQFGEAVSVLLSDKLNKGTYINNYNVSQLSSGLYFLKFKSGPFQKVEKFIISK